MPMIGGELAAEAALDGRRVAADARDLGWVTDWLYGNAALPPAPLPAREPAHPRHVPVYAEPPLHADASDPRPTPARRCARRRRSRQLALL